MKNLLFTIWMLLFPIAIDLATYIFSKATMAPHKANATMGWLQLIIWLGVGYLLYNNG